MACQVIKTKNPLVLFLKIEPDENYNGGISSKTSKEIKVHIQKTLLSRHYKKFVWDVKGITRVDSQIVAGILMSYEKSDLNKCKFFILNMETDFYKMMKVYKFNRIINMKVIENSPSLDDLDKFFEKEEVSVFDEDLIATIASELNKNKESLGSGLIATLDQYNTNTKASISLDSNLLDSITKEIEPTEHTISDLNHSLVMNDPLYDDRPDESDSTISDIENVLNQTIDELKQKDIEQEILIVNDTP